MSDLTMSITNELEQAQVERTERARSAIRAGLFQVTRVGPQQWTVKNGDKLPYAVSLEPSHLNEALGVQGAARGELWVCTCMDYRQRGPQIRCKHIEGVRLSEAAQNQSIQTIKKETFMDTPQLPPKESLSERVDRILWELRQPLDMSRVKRRQAPGMGSVPYLEGYDVIERANAVFGFAWSFDLVGEPVIVRWQKKVLAWNQQEKRKAPVTDANGNPLCDNTSITASFNIPPGAIGVAFDTYGEIPALIANSPAARFPGHGTTLFSFGITDNSTVIVHSTTCRLTISAPQFGTVTVAIPVTLQ